MAGEFEEGGVRRDVALGLLGALAYRVVFAAAIPRIVGADSIHYLAMARQFRGGDWLSFDENLPILYPAFVAVAGLLVTDLELAARIVSFIASVLLVIPVYVLARDLFGRTTARMTTAIVVLWPWLADYGIQAAPEALALLLWFSSIALLTRAIRMGGVYLMWAPLSFFLLHLARPEGTFHLLASPVFALAFMWSLERSEVPALLRRWLVYTGATVVLIGAYAVSMKFILGTATVSYRAPVASDLLTYFGNGGLEFVRTFLALNTDVLPVMLGPFFLIFIGAGLFMPSKRPRDFRLEVVVFAFCAVQYGLILVNFSPAPRYVMPIVVALMIWSARGMEAVAERAREAAALGRTGLPLQLARRLHLLPFGLAVLLMCIGTVVAIGGEFIGGRPREAVEYKIVGRWIRDNLEPGYIITRKPQIGFYAGLPTTGPAPEDGPEDIVRRARLTGARYFVIDERYTAQMAPRLAPLLEPANAPEGLRILKADLSPYADARVAVYEIVDPKVTYLTPDEFPGVDSFMGPYKQRRVTDNPDAGRP